MPRVVVDDGVGLEYADVGEGFPIVFVHEASGDMNSWAPQVHFFARRHRCITFNARGYPPSDVPDKFEMYSQERHAADVAAIMRHLGLPQAFVAGGSMGAAASIQFGLDFPELARGIIAMSAGSGSMGDTQAALAGFYQRADDIERDPSLIMQHYGSSPGRQQLKRKDPLAYEAFEEALSKHDTRGLALMLRGVQARRPTMAQWEPRLAKMEVPVLIMVGDEDDPCIEPGIFMKRHIPKCGLVMFAQAGHSLNLEEPALFNRHMLDFMTAVEAGKWAGKGAKALY